MVLYLLVAPNFVVRCLWKRKCADIFSLISFEKSTCNPLPQYIFSLKSSIEVVRMLENVGQDIRPVVRLVFSFKLQEYQVFICPRHHFFLVSSTFIWRSPECFGASVQPGFVAQVEIVYGSDFLLLCDSQLSSLYQSYR